MTCRRDILADFKTQPPEYITVANNQTIASEGVGNCQILLEGDTTPTSIKDVLYVPKLSVNLLSVSKCTSCNYKIVFKENSADILDEDNDVVATASLFNGIYRLNIQNPQSLNSVLSLNTSNSVDPSNIANTAVKLNNQILWHKRLGHLNFRSMTLLKNGLVSGVTFAESSTPLQPCEECILGKQKRLPFRKSN